MGEARGRGSEVRQGEGRVASRTAADRTSGNRKGCDPAGGGGKEVGVGVGDVGGSLALGSTTCVKNILLLLADKTHQLSHHLELECYKYCGLHTKLVN